MKIKTNKNNRNRPKDPVRLNRFSSSLIHLFAVKPLSVSLGCVFRSFYFEVYYFINFDLSRWTMRLIFLNLFLVIFDQLCEHKLLLQFSANYSIGA